jgi:hypothetical protein
MTTHTTMHSILGMIHAQELLTISLIRSLPPDVRRSVVDEFQAQVERSELPHPCPGSERDTAEAFKAHIRKLSVLLASLS